MKEAFYNVQKGPRKIYYIMLSVPIFFIVILSGVMVLLFHDFHAYNMTLDSEFITILAWFSVPWIITIGLLIFIIRKYNNSYNLIINKYLSYPEETKRRIQYDLSNLRRIDDILLKEQGMYFRDRAYVGYVNYILYEEIDWCYVISTSVTNLRPDLSSVGGVTRYGMIAIHTKDGVKHIINERSIQFGTEFYLDQIKLMAPHARYGYNNKK